MTGSILAARETHFALSLTADNPELADGTPMYPCMLCGIRDLHGTNPGKDTSTVTMPGCYMWVESRGSQPIVSWSTRRNPTGPWHQRTKVDGSHEGGKISKLQNPVQMCPYGVLGVKRCIGNDIHTLIETLFPNTRQFDDDP